MATATSPATEAIARRHSPEGSYATFRSCLRWEFGFSCAFCLIHEADLAEHGVEGTGLTSVEHHVPQSRDHARVDAYENCFYSCRFCNQSRRASPNLDARGRRLLNPCDDVWATHFRLRAYRLEPCSVDATYTHRVYDLDDPRKQRMRADRSECLSVSLRLLRDGPDLIDGLLDRAAQYESAEDRGKLVEAARILREQVQRAVRQLRRYRAIPDDADLDCRCRGRATLALPPFLENQCVALDLPSGEQR